MTIHLGLILNLNLACGTPAPELPKDAKSGIMALGSQFSESFLAYQLGPTFCESKS